MSPSSYLRELAEPVLNPVLLLAMGLFFLLAKLALAAGLIGLWLLIVILPALTRYLMEIVDARIVGRRPEPPGIELFSWVSRTWMLVPLLIVAGGIWAIVALRSTQGPEIAALAVILLLLVFPASVGVLALTRSIPGCVNPVALVTLIRLCGPRYWLIPLTLLVVATGIAMLDVVRAPRLLTEAACVYWLFLVFTLTAAIVAESNVAEHVEMPPPLQPEPADVEALAVKARNDVLNHAYGLVSRGNRDGGFTHIEQYLQSSGQLLEDYGWFFQRMLQWESNDPALFFAQRYLRFLLAANEPEIAMKVLSRCQHENPRFRPFAEDRPRLLALVRERGRDDLMAGLS